MRRRVCYRLVAVGVAGLASTAAALGAPSESVKLRVRPGAGTPRTQFVVRFTAPQRTGNTGSTVRRYTISVYTRSASGCTSSEGVAVPSTHAGEHMRITIAPQKSSLGWCAGSYGGELNETIRPVCGLREICPEYIAIRTVGRFSFRVSG